MEINEQEYIIRIQEGEKDLFGIFVKNYKDMAFSLARRMVRNPEDCEDIVQESFVKAYKSISSFKRGAKFSTWFYRIVYNTGLTVAASKKRKIEKEMSSVEDHFDLSAEDDLVYSTTDNAKEYIHEMINKLPVRHALVIILFYIDNMSLNEISQVMDVSLVNAKVLLHRSRNALRDLLIKHNYQEVI